MLAHAQDWFHQRKNLKDALMLRIVFALYKASRWKIRINLNSRRLPTIHSLLLSYFTFLKLLLLPYRKFFLPWLPYHTWLLIPLSLRILLSVYPSTNFKILTSTQSHQSVCPCQENIIYFNYFNYLSTYVYIVMFCSFVSCWVSNLCS